jgi:hypothetical protein
MATSGTYAITYDIAEFIEEAFERCEVDPATLGARHMRSARRSMNLMFSEWANLGVFLFTVDEQTQTVTDGTASYAAAAGTLAILEVIVRRDGLDTPVNAIDRAAYHSITDKTLEGLPTMFFYDRRANTFYLWGVPENSTDVIRYQRLRRAADVTTSMETADVPYQYYEALVSGLSEKLSLKFAPEKFTLLRGLASSALKDARVFDRERVDTYLSL